MSGTLVRAPYPDIEKIFVERLEDQVPSLVEGPNGIWHIGLEYPADLAKHLPFSVVWQIDGRSDSVFTYGTVDVEFLARGRDVARDLAVQAEQIFLATPYRTAAGQVDEVEVASAPKRVPWPDPAITRYHASYRISARR